MTTSVRRLRGSLQDTLLLAAAGLRMWGRRQVAVSIAGGIGFGLLVGIATVLIPNPIFGREIPPVWWNYPVLVITSMLSGMLIGTYVRTPATAGRPAPEPGPTAGRPAPEPGPTAGPAAPEPDDSSGSRMGLLGGMLAWFAVGCPVCNKLALLALGYSGAITWFAPIQPFLALGAMVLTAAAVVIRLRGQVACVMPRAQRR